VAERLRNAPSVLMMSVLWRADPRRSFVVGICVLLGGALPAVLMVTTGRVVDAIAHADAADAFSRGLWATGAFVASSLCLALVMLAGQIAQAGLSQSYLAMVEDMLARAVLGPVTIGHLEDSDVAARVGRAAEASRENVYYWSLRALASGLRLRVTGIVSGCLLFGFAWWAPLLLFSAYALLVWLDSRWMAVATDELVEVTGTSRRRAEYYRGLLGEPAAAKEVRLFSLAGWIERRFVDTWTSAMTIVWRRRSEINSLVIFGVVALVVSHALVLGVLGHRAFTGAVSIAAVAVFVQAIIGTASIAEAGYEMSGVVRTGRELRNLADLEEQFGDDTVSEHTPQPGVPGVPVSIDAVDVHFTYPGTTQPVLSGLNLHVPAGQALAIVGANGAGKSTIVKLLTGLYVPSGGQILVGHEPADPRRGMTAAIFQSFGRYDLSLRDNITLTVEVMDDPTVQAALRAAGSHGMASSLDVPLSATYAGGTDLSGGQWQRVALARALAAVHTGAGLLILDEPTAALDVRAEVELFERFLEVTRGVTTVLVSHRLSSVRHADRIVVLEGGALVEDGTHEQLLAQGGRYAEMFQLQAALFTTATDGSPDEVGTDDD
jgi:ATP-binding cassette subfamily B protein